MDVTANSKLYTLPTAVKKPCCYNAITDFTHLRENLMKTKMFFNNII